MTVDFRLRDVLKLVQSINVRRHCPETMMNKEHLRFHLQEALEELSRTVAQCENDPEFSEAELLIGMQHLYHHLNTAWNTRNLGTERIEQATDQDFNVWSLFPNDLPPMSV